MKTSKQSICTVLFTA